MAFVMPEWFLPRQAIATTMDTTPKLKTPQKTFEILEELSERGRTKFSTLDEVLDIPRTSIHEQLSTLETLGYVVNEGGEYWIGAPTLALGTRARQRRDLYKIAESHLHKVAERTNEHGILIVHETGVEGAIFRIVRSADATDMGLFEGMPVPLALTTPGKAIMSHYPEARVREIISASKEMSGSFLEAHYSDEQLPDIRNSNERIVTENLLEELDEIRERGYTGVEQGFYEEVGSVSAPITSAGEVKGAVVAGAPTQKLRSEGYQAELPELVMETANIIGVELSRSNILR